MKRLPIVCLLGMTLTALGCGSDSPAEQPQNKDATVDGRDAPPTADTKDLPSPGADADADVDAFRAQDVAKEVADALAPDAGADAEVVDVGSGADLGTERPSIDGSASSIDGSVPSIDGSKAEVSVDASAMVSFPCRDDSDCCIEIDGCMAMAYLYSRAPGAAPAPDFPARTEPACLACIPPAIQVSCVSGQCVGTRISSYSGSILSNHCGHVALDAGAPIHAHTSIDAGATTTKSVWNCGGG